MANELIDYRLLILLKPDLSEADFTSHVDEVRILIEKAKGSVKEQDLWGLRDLAYRIQAFDKGYYAHLHFLADSSTVDKIHDHLKLNETALRYMITKE